MLQYQQSEPNPRVWLHEAFLQALGVTYKVIERSGTLVLAELEEEPVPEQWFTEAEITALL